MENDIFIRPAVAGQIHAGFVEARIHVDIPKSLTDEQFAANKAKQKELGLGLAMPTFAVVDPVTGEIRGSTQLSGGPGSWEKLFTDFLRANSGQPERD